MNYIIKENEIGILTKNGVFEKVLLPGKHMYLKMLGYSIQTIVASGEILQPPVALAKLAEDADFKKVTTTIEVEEGTLALHYVGGHLKESLEVGTYVFFNVCEKHTFKILDLTSPYVREQLTIEMLKVIPRNYYSIAEIKDDQIGLLYINSKLVDKVEAGRHFFWQKNFSVKVEILTKEKQQYPLQNIAIGKVIPETLVDEIMEYTVPESHVAFHFVNNRVVEVLTSGDYHFMAYTHQHTFKQYPITSPYMDQSITREMIGCIPEDLITTIELEKGQRALLYFDEKLQEELDCGVYHYWNINEEVYGKVVELREQQLDITGQEILTADKVGIRINFVCSYRIVDLRGVVEQVKDYKMTLYTHVQLVLREYIGKYKLDDLLLQKDELAGEILNQLKANEGDYFVAFSDAGIKDIILPGDIREIMNTVLLAEKKAQASVITRREEVASTRSLLNTAKLMDENTTLYRLKELEYIERICDKVQSISVSNQGNLLEQLGKLIEK